MFERFTEAARKAVVTAQEEAQALNHAHIGTEHLLLGLLQHGASHEALNAAGIGDVSAARARVIDAVGVGEQSAEGGLPFTPRAKHVFELALRAALSHGQSWIGTEHVLIGLLMSGPGAGGVRVLTSFGGSVGGSVDEIRDQIVQTLKRTPTPTLPSAHRSKDQVWVNEDRTVLVRTWNDHGTTVMEVATREDADAVWGPPVRVERVHD